MSDFTDNQGATKEPFVTPEGWVADPDTAHEIANIHNIAENLEEVRKKEYETGLTDRERKNLEIAEVLKEEFPYALKERIDQKTGDTFYEMGIKTDPPLKKDLSDQDAFIVGTKYTRLINDAPNLESDDDLFLLLDSRESMPNPRISKKGIQFEIRGIGGTFISFEQLNPYRQDNFLKILSYLNERGKIISAQAEKEKLEITPELLRDRIKKIRRETL